jgi:uncharacterized protein (DUF58 family)
VAVDPQPGGAYSRERADAVLRGLELAITRRLDGLLHGNYLGLMPGRGSEPGESREYHPGDDVRRIDWPVTARTTIPHVRETEADRELETWVVYDASASLAFGTAYSEKRDVALAALAAIVFLAVGGGNRIGALIAGTPELIRIPPRAGRPHARAMLSRAAAAHEREAGGVGLGPAIDALRRMHHRRGLAVVISDFLGDESWQEPMRALGTIQQLIGIEVVDPREMTLPDVGVLHMVDPESGEQIEVPTQDAELRERYAAAARIQREAIATGLRRAGAAHLRLQTDRDWLVDIVRFVGEQRRRRLK